METLNKRQLKRNAGQLTVYDFSPNLILCLPAAPMKVSLSAWKLNFCSNLILLLLAFTHSPSTFTNSLLRDSAKTGSFLLDFSIVKEPSSAQVIFNAATEERVTRNKSAIRGTIPKRRRLIGLGKAEGFK